METTSGFYNKYLARDKVFRHVFQHLEIAIITFIVFCLITKVPISLTIIIIFLIFSYLPDLDGITSCFIWQFRSPTAKEVVNKITRLDIGGAITYGTVNHKKLNRLLIHNIIAYPLLIYLLVKSIQVNSYFWGSALAAFIGHITFDLIDDVYQLGHIKNYFWPFHILFPKSKLFDPAKVVYPIPQLHEKITVEPTDYIFNSGKIKKTKHMKSKKIN